MAPARRNPVNPPLPSPSPSGQRPLAGHRPEEPRLPRLDQTQVGHDHQHEDPQEAAGSAVNPSTPATGENGSTTPTAAQASVVASSGRLGRLWKNGIRRVRMMKITSVCVASDSTNQPE